MGKIVGIDSGNTDAAITVMEANQAIGIPMAEGEHLLPFLLISITAREATLAPKFHAATSPVGHTFIISGQRISSDLKRLFAQWPLNQTGKGPCFNGKEIDNVIQ